MTNVPGKSFVKLVWFRARAQMPGSTSGLTEENIEVYLLTKSEAKQVAINSKILAATDCF